MAAAACDQKIYFFGGVGGNGSESILDISNELWCFDTIALTWQQIPYGALAKSSMYWYIWAGEGLHGHVSVFWRFDFTQEEWELIQPTRPDDPIFW